MAAIMTNKKHPPISIFALQTPEQRARIDRLANELAQSNPQEFRFACQKAGIDAPEPVVASEPEYVPRHGEDAASALASVPAKDLPAVSDDKPLPDAEGKKLPPATNDAKAAELSSSSVEEPTLSADETEAGDTAAATAKSSDAKAASKTSDSSFANKQSKHGAAKKSVWAKNWRIVAGGSVAAALLIGIAVGFPAGWQGASDSIAQQAAELTPEQTADQELREQNIQARYDSLKEMGIDMDSMDRVDPDEAQAIDVDPVETEPTEEVERLADVDVSEGTSNIIDVPIVNQLDTSDGGRSLMSGCEVASLAMLLNYAGVDVTKEELQDAMPTVALQDSKGRYGNPNKAFVGDMAGSSGGSVGYSVYHGPVAVLAQDYLMNRSFKVVDLTGQSFTTLLKELANGNPCWVIATTTMQPDLVASTWETADGTITVNWALHSVLVTGYDDEHIYINNPYGYEQNVAYDRDGFEQAWKLMGSQAVTIVPTE